MAIVSTIGIRIRDYVGGEKSFPLYVPATVSLATIQSELNAFLPELDAVIDGKIELAVVTIGLTLPSGMKGAPVTGHTVREGVLNSYDAANTDFKFSPYWPSAAEAGFVGNSWLNTGIYATANGGPIVFASDKDGNALSSYLSGRRTFRK
jgi:hypothetical protein